MPVSTISAIVINLPKCPDEHAAQPSDGLTYLRRMILWIGGTA